MNLAAQKIDLHAIRFTPELTSTIPLDLARSSRVLPLDEQLDTLCIAVVYPMDLNVLDIVASRPSRPLLVRYADERKLIEFLDQLYPNQ